MSKRKKVKQEYITPEVAVQIVSNNLDRRVKEKGLKALPRGARVAVAHSLKKQDYTLRAIEDLMGIDKNTAMTYVNEEMDDKFLQFADATDKILKEKAAQLEYMTDKVLMDKLKDIDKVEMRDAITLYKVLNEGRRSISSHATNTGNMIAINVHPAVTRDTK